MSQTFSELIHEHMKGAKSSIVCDGYISEALATGSAGGLYLAALHMLKKEEADNAAMRDAIKQMLYVFDRDLEAGTVGRIICDVAIEALKGATK